MAKVLLTNTREHAIHLNVAKETVLVPGAKQNPEDRSKVIHGRLEVEQSFVDAVKKHPVGAHYFDEGWLRVNEKKAPVAQSGNQQPPAGGDKDK